MKKLFLVFALALLVTAANALAPKTISYKSEDGLEITADLYMKYEKKTTPFIVLFHRAGWSRGEYKEIALKLNDLGFNCMAVDQRSGDIINDVVNETAKRAKAKKLQGRYIDALPDMIASLKYARANFAKGKLVAWGSSYSSALSLHLAGERPELMDAVMSFAPGEYFSNQGKTADWITKSAKKIKCPVFITSAKSEHKYWKGIFEAVQHKDKQSYLPTEEGIHGAAALWSQHSFSKGYWVAVEKFLGTIKKEACSKHK